VPHDVRDVVIDFIRDTALKYDVSELQIAGWVGLYPSKFYSWCERFGKRNSHNGKVPRDFWIERWERKSIVDFHARYPLEGYRRLAFMMIDADVVSVSPSTVYRVLSDAGVIGRAEREPSKKGTGFEQPTRPHAHWHTDVSYLNVGGSFVFVLLIVDGYSRAIVGWDVAESMETTRITLAVQRAKERYGDHGQRMISDNGPQFVSKDFKEFVRQAGMTHVTTSPYYPQSNGKVEAANKTMKKTMRPAAARNLAEARTRLAEWVQHYNEVRLHSAIGYVAPNAVLNGTRARIQAERDARLAAARQTRSAKERVEQEVMVEAVM
jgi:putative transposase